MIRRLDMKQAAIVAGLILLFALASVVQAQEFQLGPFTLNSGPDDHFQRFVGKDVTVSTLNAGLIQGTLTMNYVNDFEVVGKCGKFDGKTIYVTKSAIVWIYEGYTCQ
jgi:hypothetical protein